MTAIRDIDRGYRRRMAALRRAAAPASMLVGVVGDAAESEHANADGETVAQIAEDHEFGRGVPERSWLRAWFDANKPRLEQDLSRAFQEVLRGRLTQAQALEALGLKYVGEIQERISAGIDPENSPATQVRKGSSTPLIDTGQFRSAISHMLESLL